MKAALLCGAVCAVLIGPATPLPGTGVDFEKLKKISELEAQKQVAVAAEDFGLAKQLKRDIDKLKAPPPPPPTPIQYGRKKAPELTDEQRHQKRLDAIRAMRDKDHGGDQHAMFDKLDDDDNGHMNDEELYMMFGAPKGFLDPAHPEHDAGLLKMLKGFVEGMKASIDGNGDGIVTKDEFHTALKSDEL